MTEIVGAHLVGSAPVTDPNQLFRLVHDHLSDHLRRVPDGEVGERDAWIRWQHAKLAQCPQVVAQTPDSSYLGRELQQFVIADDAQSVDLVDLGYADAALGSWELFKRAREEGTLAPHQRFMVGLPSPLSVTTMYVAPASRPAVFEAWVVAMEKEVSRIVDNIPNGSLAIQWEVVIEFGILEGIWTYLDSGESGIATRSEIAQHVLHLGSLIPDSVELGYHFCYGDAGHRHFTEPSDASHLAWAAGIVFERLDRSVEWIHLPVPRTRDDVEYFQPLADLNVPDTTELYLGLVHETGGEDGTRRRIDAASQVLTRFGVATECGLGRRPLAGLGPLLDQHAAVSSPRT
ncbi:MAG: hypothetical protein CL464_02370 [Acidimicrobiaceae bacterium]|nr:hypothetical protein [Acidimicrobiaceae bacterium]|tara:strand:- start:346 stop:1383 length:1038 start_codon:yes stop_codon:yes gene_type:complete